MKIGILGGTFDPVHKVHILSAKAAYEQLRLDKVWFMPSFIPPHKEGMSVSSYEDRLNMLKLATEDYPYFGICELEAGRNENSYTSVSLKILHDKYPNDEFFFIMGADSFYELEKWYEYEKIFSLASLAVIDREYSEEHNSMEYLKVYFERKYPAHIYFLKFSPQNVSSTVIRKEAEHKRYNEEVLDKKVIDYIKEKNLYTVSPEDKYRFIKKDLEKTLKKDRFEHSIGVSYTAAALAMAYGADIYKAKLAGLLHDCAKNMANSLIKSECETRGIPLSENDLKSPQIWHSIYGSVLAKEKYNIEDAEILSSIRYHTTGKAGMTQLEKIIFIADYIEPLRNKAKNLEIIRQEAFRSLDSAMYLIINDTAEYLSKKNIYIDENTINCLNYLKEDKEDDK